MSKTYQMVVGVAGCGTVDIDAAEALINWLVPEEDSLLIIAKDIPDHDKLVEWCDAVDQPYESVTSPDLVLSNMCRLEDESDEIALVVVGVEGSEKTIELAWSMGFGVYDMTRALFPVDSSNLEDALYEPETHAHEISDGLGGRGSLDIFVPQKPAQSLTEASPKSSIFGMEHTEQELLDIVAGMIRAHEERYHANQVPDIAGVAVNIVRDILPPVRPAELDDIPLEGTDEWKSERIRCLRSKSGKIRVSARAKAKPGEEEIWLLPEEIDA